MEQARFDQLWRDSQAAVRGLLAALVRDPTSVDDLLQEVAMVTWRRLPDYDSSRPFTAWAIGVARTCAMAWRRTHATRLRIQAEAAIEALAAAAERLAPELGAREVALERCLQDVPGRGREILRLRYAEDCEPGEIALRMRLQAGHVRVLLNRLREGLRSCIERRLAMASS